MQANRLRGLPGEVRLASEPLQRVLVGPLSHAKGAYGAALRS